MEFPTDGWGYFDIDDFDTAPPILNGPLVFELFAQLRPSGRILDHFRGVLGGSQVLDIRADLYSLIPANCFRGWQFRMQQQPRDIVLRQNMLSTGWIDGPTVLLANEGTVYDQAGNAVPTQAFMELLEELPDAGPDSFSLRFSVVANPDRFVVLQLQSLPASAVYLSGKAAYKGYENFYF